MTAIVTLLTYKIFNDKYQRAKVQLELKKHLKEKEMLGESKQGQSLSFNEIPSGTPFEQFTADLLSSMGYKILVGPGEGPDNGKDMIVSETLDGRLSQKTVKYLVSCKHLGRAVGVSDEQDIRQRVEKHGCHAFLAVCSTHFSQNLIETFDSLKNRGNNEQLFDIVTMDGAAIRKQLLELPNGPRLVRQYFPSGHTAYLRSTTESYIFRKRPVFRCTVCKVDILEDFNGSIVYETTKAITGTTDVFSQVSLNRHYSINDIRPFCEAHTPDLRTLPCGSMVFPIQKLITSNDYNRRLHEDIKFLYFKAPYLVSEAVYRKWVHLMNGLFYFVARGELKSAPDLENGFLAAFAVRYEL